jgi:hypothetical protein
MSKNGLFKTLLIIQAIGVAVYTTIVFQTQGPDLLSVFINNITSLNWSGQFNLDFSCYLTLSGLWLMWRDRFATKSIILGIVAMILGIIVFAPCLLWLTFSEKGNIKRVLIGDR